MKTSTFMCALIALFLSFNSAFAQSNSVSANSISFHMNQDDDGTILHWNTSREVNTSYFLIQKSVDGIHFINIATVKANGASMKPSNYSYEDISENEENATYRLVLVFMDGGQVCSNICMPNSSKLVNEAIAQK